MKYRYRNRLIGLSLAIGLLTISCHQEPTLPSTLIPRGCQLSMTQYIDENYMDSTSYIRDSYGYLKQTNYTSRTNGKAPYQSQTIYTLDADHYLLKTETSPIGYPTSVYTYTYEGNPKRLLKVEYSYNGTVLQTNNYQYVGDRLALYAESNVAGTTTYQVTFDANQRISQIKRDNYQIELQNGLISRTISGRDTALYTYDSQGQKLTEEWRYGTTGERQLFTFTYDSRTPTRTGELRRPGFPTESLSGYGKALSNVLTQTVRTERVGQSPSTQTFRYQYAYNNQGYALGYARSDGARARYNYTNCP